jgi:acyl carrier protein
MRDENNNRIYNYGDKRVTKEDIVKQQVFDIIGGANDFKSFDDVPNDKRMSALNADSLDCFEIILFTEDALEIEINENDLESIDFTVDELLEIIE